MRNMLYFTLTLFDWYEEQEAELVNAIPQLSGSDKLTDVLLRLPNWRDNPGAIDDPLVASALLQFKELGLTVHLAREWWTRVATADSSLAWDEDYHREGLEFMRVEWLTNEAVDYVGAYTEAHGPKDQALRQFIKGSGETGTALKYRLRDLDEMQRAISKATADVGQLDFSCPASSMTRDNYQHYTNGLARDQIHYNYSYKDAADGIKKAGLSGHDLFGRCHWWGVWLDDQPFPKSWDGHTAKDWASIRAAFPELKGAMIYIDWRKLAAAMMDMDTLLGEGS